MEITSPKKAALSPVEPKKKKKNTPQDGLLKLDL